MAVWMVVLVVIAGLLVFGLSVAAVVVKSGHLLDPPQGTTQGRWKTYANVGGEYRVSYPASFREEALDSRVGDPGLCVRFVDSQGALYALGKGELLTTFIVDAKKMDETMTQAEAASAVRVLARTDAAIGGDDAAAGMWDRRTVRAQVGEFHGWPCAIWETTYRCKRGGRQHDIVYMFYVGATYFQLQMGSGQSSWDRVQPMLQRFADSFSTG